MSQFLSIVALLPLMNSAGSVPDRRVEADQLLPAESRIVVTVNLRQFLDDHRNTPFMQHYLDQWRLAVKGDEKQLRKYYRDQELDKSEGIDEDEFLERARQMREFADKLGMEVLSDVDTITIALGRDDRGTPNLLAVLVEGRFQTEKLKQGMKSLGQKHFGSVRATRVGDVEILQIPDEDGGFHVAVLNDKTLAIAPARPVMNELLERSAGKKKGRLEPGMRTLLANLRQEHISVVLVDVPLIMKDVARLLKEEVAPSLDGSDVVGKLLAGQLAGWLEKNAGEVTSVGLGLSLKAEELRLHVGVEAKKAETAKEFRTQINRNNVWAALALKTIDSEVTQQLADILARQRVVVKDATLTSSVEVPYEFIKLLLKGTGLVSTSQKRERPDPLTSLVLAAGDQGFRRISSIPLFAATSIEAKAVQEVRDVSYRNSLFGDSFRNQLDMYLPKGKKDFPVVVLVHGGAWVIGDNRCCGLYCAVGRFLASQGIGVVMPNYRLSPGVKHPDHVRDIAAAVAWTQRNIAKHGGDPHRLFLAGHSAGGHLVSLLATDESYLKAEGLNSKDIHGVIAVSGVYQVPHGLMRMALGGTAKRGFLPRQMLPIRGDASPFFDLPIPGLPVSTDMFGPVFGDEAKVRDDASPTNHARAGLPPFLLLSAEYDLPTLRPMAEQFAKALVRAGCDARLMKMAKRNHNSLMFSAIGPTDPAARAILDFIAKHN